MTNLDTPHDDAAKQARAACRHEVSRRETLSTITTGQIADSYDTLHGVRFIALILETLPDILGDHDKLHYCLYLFDAFIIENLTELSARAADALEQDQIYAAVDALAWMERLLRLMHDASGLAPPLRDGHAQPPLPSAFQTNFERLCQSLRNYLQAESAPLGEDRQRVEAELFHQSKNIILQVRETVLNERRAPPPQFDPRLVDAHLETVAAASLGIRLNDVTDINQFCLLHQLPELLTPLVLRRFEIIEQGGADDASTVHSARIAGDLLFLITASLWPLIERLKPSAYYAFRENLGATSGSSSASIRGKLLTSAYVRLAKHVVALEMNSGAGLDRDLAEQIARIRRLIYRWRGLHMALPRNVLGANGTKSLMGSPDALKAVETMADSFSKRDPLTVVFGPVGAQDFATDSAAAALDLWLLTKTGDVAQQRFRQVQDRTGPWRKMQKID